MSDGTNVTAVSVFGLGYVGAVSAACLAQMGHRVVGVDTNNDKLEMLREGRSPVLEPGLDRMIPEAVDAGRLTVTPDAGEAVAHTEVSLICVGTPSNHNGSLDLSSVEKVCGEIGNALADKDTYHVVVVRSTVLPGTARETIIPTLEAHSGKVAGRDFGFAVNPEFLRESSAVSDFFSPSFTLIGEIDERSGETVAGLYEPVEAETVRTEIETAEMVKYVSNAYHALKVCFANEVGSLAKLLGIDGREVMEIFARDDRLNVSAAYLRPGYAFGGSCLPKDTRALVYRARELDLETPVLSSLIPSNRLHAQRGVRMVEETGCKKVGVLGLSFKAGTDDVRESPMVPLIETLVGRGYEVKVYDQKVQLSRLLGANRAFLEREIPHIATLLTDDLDAVLAQSEVLVVGNSSEEFRKVPSRLRPDQVLVDLVGIDGGGARPRGYEGICW